MPKIIRESDLPCYFELRGRKEMLIDGLDSLLKYDEKELSILCGGSLARLWGEDLKIDLLNDGRALLKGNIKGFEFSEQSGEE